MKHWEKLKKEIEKEFMYDKKTGLICENPIITNIMLVEILKELKKMNQKIEKQKRMFVIKERK